MENLTAPAMHHYRTFINNLNEAARLLRRDEFLALIDLIKEESAELFWHVNQGRNPLVLTQELQMAALQQRVTV